MKLYHGTNIAFDSIDLSKSHVGKDFGVGFYLTPDFYVAKRQAERKYEQSGAGLQIVLKYEWKEDSAKELNILRFESYSLEWAKFVLSNRKNKSKVQLHNYDIVVGPIADDIVGVQIRRFEDGVISLAQFLEEIKYNKMTFQYFFGTAKSLLTLQRL